MICSRAIRYLVDADSRDGPASPKDFQMNNTHDTTAMLKGAMADLPIDTSAAEGAFKSSAELIEKISTVALNTVEKSAAISQQWTQHSLKSLLDVSNAKSAPTDYMQAMTDFAAGFSKAATEHMTAFADNAKNAQTDTLELLMAAGKNFGEEATSAAKTAGTGETFGSKTTAAK
jgi:hypothetical protein